MTQNPPVSDFLVSRSSYLSGAATAFNLVGNFYDYNVSRNAAEADARALRSDFAVVGEDIRRAIYAHENVPNQLLLFK